MKKLLIATILLAACAAWAADTTQKTDAKPAPAAATPVEPAPKKATADKQAKPEKKVTAAKKEPGAMEKAGNSVKSGWHKFKKSVQQGRKTPACTPEQRSMNQCK